jgi:7,8-dihydropterin-6-yl-methyl-4-(beta-D-ribofuranosyl)aminobenzene 5'-phosphate synthase
VILKVIVDNNTFIDQYYCGEPAVSFYIEDEDMKLLLDVGYSDLFLKNMEQFGINVNDLDAVIISHGHDDHTRGLKFLFSNCIRKDLKLIGHPQAFEPKSLDNELIGSPFNKDELMNLCDLELSKNPMKVSKHIIFLGEIPQESSHEKRERIGKTRVGGEIVDDDVIEDSALVFRGESGIYIITGCSHSGICNIVEYGKKVTGCDNVIGVIGGLHLFDLEEKVYKTIDYLEKNGVKELYPCHCTSFKVKAAINNVIEVHEVGVGLELNWN